MTEHELSGYKFIKARIEKIQARIAELEQENGLGAVNLDGMPHGTSPGDPVARLATARADLYRCLQEQKAELEERERQIREYIESIDDAAVKLIAEWRFIDLLDWYDIAGKLEDVTGKNVDRTTPAKKLRKYLQEH